MELFDVLVGSDRPEQTLRIRISDLRCSLFAGQGKRRAFDHHPDGRRRLRLATQDCFSRKATMGRELMALRTDHTTRIPSAVAFPVTTHHAANESVFVDLINAGGLKDWLLKNMLGRESGGRSITIRNGGDTGIPLTVFTLESQPSTLNPQP